MANPTVRFPLISKIVCVMAGVIIVCPSFCLYLIHRFNASVPVHADFLTRLLVSVFGLAVMLLGLIPALVLANRSDAE